MIRIRSDSSSRGPSAAGVLRAAVFGLAGLGFCLSMILVFQSGGSAELPGCGEGSGCVEVLSSPLASVFGMPVAVLALVVYSAVVVAAMYVDFAAPSRRGRWGWRVLLGCAAALVAAAAYFLGVQAFKLDSWCMYCLAAHGIGLALAAALLWAAPIGAAEAGLDLAGASVSAAVALVLVGALAAIQYAQPAPGADIVELDPDAIDGVVDLTGSDAGSSGAGAEDGEGADRELSLWEGRVLIKPAQYPMIGSPDAPVLAVELYDYTCPHCRRLYRQLKKAKQRYGDQLSLVLVPVPLDSACNELVEKTNHAHKDACLITDLAHAIWLAAPDRFLEFHEWVFESARAPEGWKVRRFARDHVGDRALRDAMKDRWTAEQMERNITLYRLMGKGTLPKLVIGDQVLRGSPRTDERLFEKLESMSSLRPLESAPEPEPEPEPEPAETEPGSAQAP